MNLIELKQNEKFQEDKETREVFLKLSHLSNDLSKRELTDSVIESINQKIGEINTSNETERPLGKLLSRILADLLKLLEKELKLVPKHHYRNQWMVLGMSAFGLPFGVVFGMSLGSMAYLGLGLPIGMAIGIAVGVSMDEKAKKEGRQLNLSEED